MLRTWQTHGLEPAPAVEGTFGAMKIRISIEYEVTDDKPELENLGAEVIRAEADALVETVKRKLSAAGAEVTSVRADYE